MFCLKIHSNMLKAHSPFFNRPATKMRDKLHDISQNTERNINTTHDVRFDIIKQNDTRKITCPLIIVHHIFYHIFL